MIVQFKSFRITGFDIHANHTQPLLRKRGYKLLIHFVTIAVAFVDQAVTIQFRKKPFGKSDVASAHARRTSAVISAYTILRNANHRVWGDGIHFRRIGSFFVHQVSHCFHNGQLHTISDRQ